MSKEVWPVSTCPDCHVTITLNPALVHLCEYDPVGTPLGGVKHDQGKPPLGMIPAAAMQAEAQVLAFGAEKYGRDNWRKGITYTRLADAALRHIFAFLEGEDADPESGLPHLAHALCCLGFLLHFEYAPTLGIDDRPKEA